MNYLMGNLRGRNRVRFCIYFKLENNRDLNNILKVLAV